MLFRTCNAGLRENRAQFRFGDSGTLRGLSLEKMFKKGTFLNNEVSILAVSIKWVSTVLIMVITYRDLDSQLMSFFKTVWMKGFFIVMYFTFCFSKTLFYLLQ